MEGEDDNCNIFFYDVVRLLIDEIIISNCIEFLKIFEVVDVVILLVDILVEVYDDGCIFNILNCVLMWWG